MPSKKLSRKKTPPKSRSRLWTILLVVAGVLVLATVAAYWVAPPFILETINKNLNKNPEYKNRVEGLHLHLFGGGYTLENMVIQRRLGKEFVPVFTAKDIRVSLDWSALVRGRFTANGRVTQPVLTLHAPFLKPDPNKPKGAWKRTLDILYPVPIDEIVVRDGAVHFKDYAEKGVVNLFAEELNGTARGLTALRDSTRSAKNDSATLNLTAKAMGSAPFTLELTMRPGTRYSDLDVRGELEEFPLTALNPLFRSRAGLDVESGTFAIQVDARTEKGKFTGSVQPDTRNLKILSDEGDEGFVQKVWEKVVEVTAKVVTDPKKPAVNSDNSFSGTIADAGQNEWHILGDLLRGAFLRALDPRLGRAIRFEEGLRWDDQIESD